MRWTDSANRIWQQPGTADDPRKEWTQVFLAEELPQLMVARYLKVSSTTGKLSKSTLSMFDDLPGVTSHAPLKRDMSEYL